MLRVTRFALRAKKVAHSFAYAVDLSSLLPRLSIYVVLV